MVGLFSIDSSQCTDSAWGGATGTPGALIGIKRLHPKGEAPRFLKTADEALS